MVRGFEIVVGVGRVVASLTEMRQKTYWTSQTVTAHKDGWPSLLVTTSVQGGAVTRPALSPPPPAGRWKEGRVLRFWRETWVHVVCGVGVGSPRRD